MTKRHETTRQRAKELRADMTGPERMLWSVLRAGQLGVKFQRQVVLAPYIADFAARSERLVIEIEVALGREGAPPSPQPSPPEG